MMARSSSLATLGRALAAVLAICSIAGAQPAVPSTTSTPSTTGVVPPTGKPLALPKGEVDMLVGPGGAAFEIPIHPRQICTLSFAENIASTGLASAPDLEIKPWGAQALGVRAESLTTPVTTLAISTVSGSVKVNLTLRVVPPEEEALTMVRFRAVSAEEAFQARLEKEMAKRLAPLQAKLELAERNIDAKIRERADGMVTDRALLRRQVVALNAHARTDEHVIAHVEQALILGEDAYLFFEIENRSTAPFRLARAAVLVDNRTVSGLARLRSAAVDKDPALLGLVAAGTSARGVVAVRGISSLLRKPLILELAGPNGRGSLRVDRGIVLR
jgi:hypothetical protein